MYRGLVDEKLGERKLASSTFQKISGWPLNIKAAGRSQQLEELWTVFPEGVLFSLSFTGFTDFTGLSQFV